MTFRHARVISEITLSIDSSLYNYIADSTSARKVWDNLAKAFDDSGTARKITILNKLVSVKLINYNNMERYINDILLYWNKTKIAGFNIEEQVIASLMLGGLPGDYRSMILGIENRGRKLTVDYVRCVLLQGNLGPFKTNQKNRALWVRKTSNNYDSNKRYLWQCTTFGK